MSAVSPYSANIPQTHNLEGSGQPAVLTTSLYSVIGAVALERGGEAANKVVQDKILTPLGFTFAEQPWRPYL